MIFNPIYTMGVGKKRVDPSQIFMKTGDILYNVGQGESGAMTLLPGRYKIQCWGARGNNSTYRGGTTYTSTPNGGYACGTLDIKEAITIYIKCGGVGSKTTNSTSASQQYSVAGGYNGGGAGCQCYYDQACAGSGGGATDVRIGTDSLYARVIVAGGGGAAKDSSTSGYGGAGGGTTGLNGAGSATTDGNSRHAGAGSQSQGGTATTNTYGTKISQNGSFGQGGGFTSIQTSSAWANGGGGGWYGGGAGNCDGAGGGGSSYVYTKETASTAESISGWKLNSKYYMTNSSNIAGSSSMPSPSAGTQSTMTGNNNAGAIRIDCLERYGHTVYIKSNNKWRKI